MFGRLFDSPVHLFLLLLVIVLLFGYKKLPDAARGIGRSMRIFKSEVKAMQEDDKQANPSPRPADPEPLEGRVVDSPPRAASPADSGRTDA